MRYGISIHMDCGTVIEYNTLNMTCGERIDAYEQLCNVIDLDRTGFIDVKTHTGSAHLSVAHITVVKFYEY